jgi:predicted transglutaminase-like cysteine proteinase
VYDGSEEQRAAIKTATSSMITVQSEVTKAQMQLSRLTAEKSALLSEQSLINSAMTTDVRSNIWCADFTEDLTPGVIVGTIEINGVDNQIVIMPGGKETGALGLIQHSGVSTGAAVFYNKTLLPCWQKWKPTYRIGTIIAIDNENDTCDVGIAAQYSNEQGLPINQDGEAWNSVESLVAGWDAFAAENPEFPLVSNTSDTTIPMTDILKAALDNVQSEINDRNKYITDTKQYGKLENWAIMEEGGSGDCVANYEEIYVIEGLKKVGDLKVGDVALSYDLNEKQYVYKPITKIWEKGLLQGYSVGLKNGQHVDVSDGQPMWVRANQGFVHGKKVISKYEKRYFKDIDLSRWWKRRLPIVKKLPYQVNDIEWLTEDLCFIVGHYLAEGWKEGGHVCSSGYDITDRVLPLLNKTTIPYSEYKNNSGVPCIRFLKSDFKEFLKTLKCSSFDIHLPEELFHLSENKLRAILDGYWVGDGHNGNYPPKIGCTCNKQEVYSTSSIQWAADLQRIGLQLGESFHVWKQTNHQGVGTKPIYRITKNTNSHFYHDHGYEGLSEIGIARKHIENIGLVEMRDFEVADTHTFIFKNGLVCHQCEDFALTKAKKLLDMGYPASALHIEVGTIPGGEGHAWLVVQTDQGDYALDNIFKPIMKNTLLPYSGRKRQTGSNWINKGVKLSDVTIEYMDGANSDAFIVGDRVVVAFTDQDWNKPKVIGFETNPRAGYKIYVKYQFEPSAEGSRTRTYTPEGLLLTDVPITQYSGSIMGANHDGKKIAVLFDPNMGRMRLAIDFYQNKLKSTINIDLWQGNISAYFSSHGYAREDCVVQTRDIFFDENDNVYVSFLALGGNIFVLRLSGFVAINSLTGNIFGYYSHNYYEGYADAVKPPYGYITNGKIYLADRSDGISGGNVYPILRILNESDYGLDQDIVLTSVRSYPEGALAVRATATRIYCLYLIDHDIYLKVFNQSTMSVITTVLLCPVLIIISAEIMILGARLLITIVYGDPIDANLYIMSLDGHLEKTVPLEDRWQASFTLASANII